LNIIKHKLKLYLSNDSYRYKFDYSIDNGKITEKYGELKGHDTIKQITYAQFDKLERGNT
jgi:hypothetical protein